MIALNHAFLCDIAHDQVPRMLEALRLIEHVRRRTRVQPRVHESLSVFDTGAGPLIQWANRFRKDTNIGPFVELLLRMVSGPFLPEARYDGPIEPSIDAFDEWVIDLVRRLLAVSDSGVVLGLISPEPAGSLEAQIYIGAERSIFNWRNASGFDRELTANSTGTTIDVLLDAEQQMGGQLIVLPSARRSAASWTLDCRASELHRALLGLELYAAALVERASDGTLLSREECARRYHLRTTIPMSEESRYTWRNPARRRRRMFVAGSHGEQYFDMHAKPGNMTRVHVWTPAPGSSGGPVPIYVGHCGKHLE